MTPPHFPSPLTTAALPKPGARRSATRATRTALAFHGVPKSYHMAGDPYHCQCLKTARLLREELGWDKNSFHATFQSRFGSEPWLQPYTDESVVKLAENGVRHVMVMAPGFVADCLNGGRRPPAEPHFILMLNPHNSGVSTAAQDISFEKLSSFTNSSTYI